MVDMKCPKCDETQKQKPLKAWEYSNIKVSRFECKCGQLFNFYKGKNKNWTIPKSEKL